MVQDKRPDPAAALPEASELDVSSAPVQPSGGLVAIAEAIQAAKGDLPATVERIADGMDEQDRQKLVGEMMSLEEQNPGAFLAGALAGFALGRSTAAAQTAEGETLPGGEAPPEQQQPAEAGVVVSAPPDMVQMGHGGPGYLEQPANTDEKA